eukprot:4646098-Amphidinium_carterae.7
MSRGQVHRSALLQHRAHGASSAAAPTIPGGLDKDEHMSEVSHCNHPYTHLATSEVDAEFVIDLLVDHGIQLHAGRQNQVQHARSALNLMVKENSRQSPSYSLIGKTLHCHSACCLVFPLPEKFKTAESSSRSAKGHIKAQ